MLGHHALLQSSDEPDHVSLGENSGNDQSERVKETPDRSLEQMNDYRMEKMQLDSNLLQEKVVMETKKYSVVDMNKNRTSYKDGE